MSIKRLLRASDFPHDSKRVPTHSMLLVPLRGMRIPVLQMRTLRLGTTNELACPGASMC